MIVNRSRSVTVSGIPSNADEGPASSPIWSTVSSDGGVCRGSLGMVPSPFMTQLGSGWTVPPSPRDEPNEPNEPNVVEPGPFGSFGLFGSP